MAKNHDESQTAHLSLVPGYLWTGKSPC